MLLNLNMKTILLLCLAIFSLQLNAQKNTTIEGKKYSLVHPSSWSIDKTDPDFDPETLFTLQSPDSSSMIMFIFLDMFIDNDEMLDAQVKEFRSQVIKNPESETAFTSWGRLTGKGMMIKGNLLGILPGTVRIFTWNNGERSMVIIEQYFDEDYDKISKDYKLIESSFKSL